MIIFYFLKAFYFLNSLSFYSFHTLLIHFYSIKQFWIFLNLFPERLAEHHAQGGAHVDLHRPALDQAAQIPVRHTRGAVDRCV